MSIKGQGHFFTIYFQVLYVLCFTWPRYQVSVYRTIGPLVRHSSANYSLLCGTIWSKFELPLDIMHVLDTYKFKMDWINTKREQWKRQFFRRLRAANSVARGRIWPNLNPSKLFCMSSLPVSMKKIPSRTTEKKWQHRFFKL